MRDINGYVFIVNIGFQQIFGRKSTLPFVGYEALATNGINPYINEDEARLGALEFEHRHNTQKTSVGILEMKLAEHPEENGYFKDKESLIVVLDYGFEKVFIGPSARNGQLIGSLPGAHLTINGFNAFNTINGLSAYEGADYLVREITPRLQARIATFGLRFIQ